MKDPYLYPGKDILINLLSIQDDKLLKKAEAEYTAYQLSLLATDKTIYCFDFNTLCQMHYRIFQDIYEWAGKPRVINIEKSETVLGGISIEYSDCFDIKKDAENILCAMNAYDCDKVSFETMVRDFSSFMAELWKVHPFREGNTRTVVTFCNKFIEEKGYCINQKLLSNNSEYLRTALVAASAIFSDIGDKRKPEYLEKIVSEALKEGWETKKLNAKASVLNKLNENKKIVSKEKKDKSIHSRGREDKEK